MNTYRSQTTLTRSNRHPQGNTHQVVSLVAYLIGVPKKIFANENEPLKLEIYEELNNKKAARIIRNLCRLRTAIEKNYKKIFNAMAYEYKNIHTIPELVPYDCIQELSNDGISIVKSRATINEYIISINKLILDRINNCQDLFPIWINWEYIRDIFIMPDGLSDAGLAEAANLFYSNYKFYPYQVYMNWPPSDQGNILGNDNKFITLLYSWHEDAFGDISKVTDAGDYTKDNIYSFLKNSTRTLMVVDCENSDPYKLCATLNNLSDGELESIVKIVLYDDIHTPEAWRSLENFIDIPIEHRLVERVKENKSLVDPVLIGGIYKEYYTNDIDSFILVSSDSDYWGLISSLTDAHWLVMIEREKCGPDMKAALREANIFYCYMDYFNTGNSTDFMTTVLLKDVRRRLDKCVALNLNSMMERAYCATRVNMTDKEKEQFYNKYLKSMRLVIADNGDVKIELQVK